jgi:hypothetical protein
MSNRFSFDPGLASERTRTGEGFFPVPYTGARAPGAAPLDTGTFFPVMYTSELLRHMADPPPRGPHHGGIGFFYDTGVKGPWAVRYDEFHENGPTESDWALLFSEPDW